jgi:hypothetical protein
MAVASVAVSAADVVVAAVDVGVGHEVRGQAASSRSWAPMANLWLN